MVIISFTPLLLIISSQLFSAHLSPSQPFSFSSAVFNRSQLLQSPPTVAQPFSPPLTTSRLCSIILLNASTLVNSSY